jgi:hypothetical protein
VTIASPLPVVFRPRRSFSRTRQPPNLFLVAQWNKLLARNHKSVRPFPVHNRLTQPPREQRDEASFQRGLGSMMKLTNLGVATLCAVLMTALTPGSASSAIYDVIELRWYGGVYAGGDQYADLFQDQTGVPLEITSAVFWPNGVGGVTACCGVSLIALGTTASLNWEQAILASYVVDADADYVHPSFIKLPLGTVSDLPFSLTTTPAVPEPSTWAMLLIGFAAMGFMAYRSVLGRLMTWRSVRLALAALATLAASSHAVRASVTYTYTAPLLFSSDPGAITPRLRSSSPRRLRSRPRRYIRRCRRTRSLRLSSSIRPTRSETSPCRFRFLT